MRDSSYYFHHLVLYTFIFLHEDAQKNVREKITMRHTRSKMGFNTCILHCQCSSICKRKSGSRALWYRNALSASRCKCILSFEYSSVEDGRKRYNIQQVYIEWISLPFPLSFSLYLSLLISPFLAFLQYQREVYYHSYVGRLHIHS